MDALSCFCNYFKIKLSELDKIKNLLSEDKVIIVITDDNIGLESYRTKRNKWISYSRNSLKYYQQLKELKLEFDYLLEVYIGYYEPIDNWEYSVVLVIENNNASGYVTRGWFGYSMEIDV